jgi:hypothetical protein
VGLVEDLRATLAIGEGARHTSHSVQTSTGQPTGFQLGSQPSHAPSIDGSETFQIVAGEERVQ